MCDPITQGTIALVSEGNNRVENVNSPLTPASLPKPDPNPTKLGSANNQIDRRKKLEKMRMGLASTITNGKGKPANLYSASLIGKDNLGQ